MLINPGFKKLKRGKWLLQLENDQLDGTGLSKRYLCHQSQTPKVWFSKICLLIWNNLKILTIWVNQSINRAHWQTNAHNRITNSNNCVVPLGLDPIGSHRMGPDVCTHALRIMKTDTGLWPRSLQNFDTHNVNSALIHAYEFIYFMILTF